MTRLIIIVGIVVTLLGCQGFGQFQKEAYPIPYTI